MKRKYTHHGTFTLYHVEPDGRLTYVGIVHNTYTDDIPPERGNAASDRLDRLACDLRTEEEIARGEAERAAFEDLVDAAMEEE